MSEEAGRALAVVSDVVRRAGTPAFAVDDKRRIVAWNQEVERLTGSKAADVLGRPCHAVVGGLDAQGNTFCRPGCNVVWACRLRRPIFPFLVSIRAAGGARRAALMSLVALPSRAGLMLVHGLRCDGQPAPAGAPRPLTSREREVLHRLAGGLVVKEVAAALSLSVATVRSHVRNCLHKLGAHSQLEAIALAFRNGLL